MLGFGNLSFLQALGQKFELSKPSLANAFFMGAGAGLVAAPCTGPVLGAVLTYVSSLPNPRFGVLLVVAYSLGFALPYVFLGMASGFLSRRKVSVRLQVAIKLIFSALMFALVFYFLRIPAYEQFKLLRPAFPNLAASGLGGGLSLLFLLAYRPQIFATKKLSLLTSLILGLGLFSAWQTSTLVSQHALQSDLGEVRETLVYKKDLNEALTEAKLTGRPIFLDNWAEWCEACKKMDVTTFQDPAIIDELSTNWIIVKLDMTLMEEKEEAHLAAYEIQGLPTMTMIGADGSVPTYQNVVGYQSAEEILPQLIEFREAKANP